MGAEARRPLGIVAVGGLFVSQLLTLYVIPTFYVAVERLSALGTLTTERVNGTMSGLVDPLEI